MTELLLFRVGTMQFAVDLPLVSNIQSAKSSIVRHTDGAAQLLQTESGAELPLYDLSSLFDGNGGFHDSEDKKIIMLQVDEKPIGLVVDRVDQVVAAGNDELEPLSPIFKGPARACFPRVLKQGNLPVLLLAPEGIVKTAGKTVGMSEFNPHERLM
jgi:purine-binding chemotaxis protein CheW